MYNYFFVDGSSLIADIYSIQNDEIFKNKKLNLIKFVNHFTKERLHHLHGGGFTRFVFYFVKSDDRVNDTIILPDFKNPGEVEDIGIKYCGKKLKRSAQVDTWIQKNSPPSYVLDRLHKSEKAVDTQICCDALQLAAVNRLDRLFLYTNDTDFIPLCETLKSLGRNISLFRLSKTRVNADLANACDTFSVVKNLEKIFT